MDIIWTEDVLGCADRIRRLTMWIEDLIERKKELGYTNEMISEKSGVPLSTVNKIFGGITTRPRYNTLQSLECVLFPEKHDRREAAINKELVRNLSLDYADSVEEDSALSEYSSESSAAERKHSYEKVVSWKNQGEFTVADWINLPERSYMELIDGFLYDRNSPTTIHQFIANELCTELTIGIRGVSNEHRDCLVLAPAAVQPDKDDDKTGLIPDVLIVCDREKYKDGGTIIGAPDFVAEVMSPSTRRYDQGHKFNKYWKAGVREYWIVDPENEELWVYQFEKGIPPESYSFEDRIPLGISGGEIVIDFKSIADRMRRLFGE